MKTDIAKIKEIKRKLGKDFIDRFISTYGDLGQIYLKFLAIKKQNKTHKQIADTIGADRVTVTEWINYKQIPWSIKSLLEVHDKNFHKIPKHVLARIIGWGMGDGGLDERPHYFFFCSNKRDLKEVKIFLEDHIKLKCFVKRNKTFGRLVLHDGTVRNFSGDNWILRISDTSFARFLHVLGLPKGEKVLQIFQIPEWIKNGNKKIKKEFLSAIFECELERFRLQFQKKKTYTKIIINAPIFGMCKIEKHMENLNDFLNQIRCILAEFDIKTSSLSIPIKTTLRRDGNLTYFIRFNVRSAAENILKFNKSLDLRFNRDKRETLKIVVSESKKKVKREVKQIEKYYKSQILFGKGYNFSQIARKLKITHPTAKEWVLIGNHLPAGTNKNKSNKVHR